MQAFCPLCGEDTPGIGKRGLCAECYLERNELIDVPDELAGTLCSKCGRVRIKMEWKDADTIEERITEVLNFALGDAADHVVNVGFEQDTTTHEYRIDLYVEKTVDGTVLRQKVETEIDFEKDQCPVCAKFYGGYYEYKVQLRGDDSDRLEDALGVMMDAGADMTDDNREHFIADVKHKHGGYDIYVSSRTMAEVLLKELDKRYSIERTKSKELIGQNDEGQEVYRSVIAARLQ